MRFVDLNKSSVVLDSISKFDLFNVSIAISTKIDLN